MTVKELMDILDQYSESADIVVNCYDCGDLLEIYEDDIEFDSSSNIVIIHLP